MSFLCCCLTDQASEEERQPILGEAQSARISHLPPEGFQKTSGRIIARRVDVPDLDQSFTEFAEMFNRQQENYECMQEKLNALMHHYRCAPDSSLSDCLQQMKVEHYNHQIILQLKGYDFSLTVTPGNLVPDKLKQTQETIEELCQAAKAIVSLGPKLEEMINWLLKSEQSLNEKMNAEVKTHQESTRLRGNLKVNLRETSRAKELSPRYREEARKLYSEVAMLSEIKP